MRDVSLLKERMPLAIVPDGKGGFDVTFDHCGHTVWFAILPYLTQQYYCSKCFDLFIETMKAERDTLSHDPGEHARPGARR